MPILRDCSPALAAALADGSIRDSADLFYLLLSDGVSQFFWTSWDKGLLVGTQSYSSMAPWLRRSRWNVSNTMEVPTLAVDLLDSGTSFDGGGAIVTQVSQGLLDGATFLLSRAYMVDSGDTSALGTIDLFGGKVAGLDLIDNAVSMNIKGRVNDLDQFVPRNVVQVGCNHAFCDLGCTLARATFTAAFAMGASPTGTFVPWQVAPGNPTNYIGGTVAVTSGAASGARRTVVYADATGLTLAYPLYATPMAGDAFTAFQGCDKTFNSGSGRSCTDRANTQNYRGFEFVPPPNTAT